VASSAHFSVMRGFAYASSSTEERYRKSTGRPLECTGMLAEVMALENSLKQILYGCVEHVQATKAALYLSSFHDLNEKKYEIVTSYQYNAANRRNLTANDDLVDRLAVKRSAFIVNGVGTDQRLAEMMFRQGNDRLLATPIFSRGRLVGFIDMRDKAGKKPFEPADILAANGIAEQVLQLLSSHRLYGLGAIPLSDDPSKPAPSESAAPSLMIPQGIAKPSEAAMVQPLSMDSIKTIQAARQVMSKRQLAASERKRVLAEADLDAVRVLLPAALSIPGAVLAYFGAIGHLNDPQSIVSVGNVTDDAIEKLQSHLQEWRAQHNLAAAVASAPQITQPFGVRNVPVSAEVITTIRTAAVNPHLLPGLLLAVAFERTPAGEETRTLQLLLRQFEQAIESALTSTAARNEKQAIAEVLLEPDFQKYPQLADHCRQTASLAQRFAQSLELPPATIETVRLAALVHDVGLRLLDYDRLHNRLGLTPEEMRGIAEHPIVGAALVEPLLGPDVAQAVLRHHERVDGKGYPSRLSGQQIPLAARILQIADAWIAMTAASSYQTPVSTDEATRRLRSGAGAQFDRELVARFLQKRDELVN